MAQAMQAMLDSLASGDCPESQKNNIACPFVQHNPGRYAHVRDTCTTGVGFNNTGKLNEHIKRVHTRTHGCLVCGHRFTKGKLGDARAQHSKDCKPSGDQREYTPDRFSPEWMTEEQERDYSRLVFPRGHQSNGPREVFEQIYMCLWKDTPRDMIPQHLHKSGPLVSLYEVQQGFQTFLRQQLLPGPTPPQHRQISSEADAARAEIARLEKKVADLQAQMYGPNPRPDSPQSTVSGAMLTKQTQARESNNQQNTRTFTPPEPLQSHVNGFSNTLSRPTGSFSYMVTPGSTSNGGDSGFGSSGQGEDDACNWSENTATYGMWSGDLYQPAADLDTDMIFDFTDSAFLASEHGIGNEEIGMDGGLLDFTKIHADSLQMAAGIRIYH